MIRAEMVTVPARTHTLLIHVTAHGGDNSLVVALLGVAVGAFLTFLASLALARRRTKARLRAAERLLGVDLVGKSMGAMAMLNGSVWPRPDSMPPFLTDIEAWRAARHDLSFGDREAWFTLTSLYVQVERVDQRSRRAPGDPLTVEDRRLLQSLQSSAMQAIALLGVLSEVPPWFRLRARMRHRHQRRDALANVRAERLRQSQALAGEPTSPLPDPNPPRDDEAGVRVRRGLVFGRFLPRTRPDEAYMRTLREWWRERH